MNIFGICIQAGGVGLHFIFLHFPFFAIARNGNYEYVLYTIFFSLCKDNINIIILRHSLQNFFFKKIVILLLIILVHCQDTVYCVCKLWSRSRCEFNLNSVKFGLLQAVHGFSRTITSFKDVFLGDGIV